MGWLAATPVGAQESADTSGGLWKGFVEWMTADNDKLDPKYVWQSPSDWTVTLENDVYMSGIHLNTKGKLQYVNTPELNHEYTWKGLIQSNLSDEVALSVTWGALSAGWGVDVTNTSTDERNKSYFFSFLDAGAGLSFNNNVMGYETNQFFIGGGYGINYVPYHRDPDDGFQGLRNLTLNVVICPMLTLVNKLHYIEGKYDAESGQWVKVDERVAAGQPDVNIALRSALCYILDVTHFRRCSHTTGSNLRIRESIFWTPRPTILKANALSTTGVPCCRSTLDFEMNRG